MPVRYLANKLKRFFVHRVLSLDDTPHRIALGVAIGIFVTWTPTMGFQMVLTIALAALLRANKLVGVPFVWISNPLTLVPVYGPNYLVGAWLLGGNYSYAKFLEAMSQAVHSHGSWLDRTNTWLKATMTIFWPLWVGSIVVGLLLGAATYVAIYYGVVAFRRRLHRHDEAKPPQEAP